MPRTHEIAFAPRQAPYLPVELDRNSPLAEGLRFYAVGGAGAGVPYDLTRARQGSVRAAWNPTPAGASLTGGQFGNAGTADLAFTSGKWSVWAYFYLAAALANGEYQDAFDRNAYVSETNNQGWSLQMIPPDASPFGNRYAFVVFNNNGQVNYRNYSNSSFPLTVGLHTAAGVVTQSGNNLLYVDGRSCGAGSTNNNNPAACAGPVSFGGGGAKVRCLAAGAWGRVLTQQEVALLHAGPFALCRPARRPAYFLPPQTAGGVTERYANNPISTLSAACGAADGTVAVANAAASGFSVRPQFRVVVDSEVMLVTAVAGNAFTVNRGWEGTAAAAHANGAAVGQVLTQASLQAVSPLPCEGRLTFTSGTPVTAADVTGASAATLYFTPFTGDRVALFDGQDWQLIYLTEASIAVPAGAANDLYDVFAYLSSGAVALELSAKWAGVNARADALAQRDGVYVKASDYTRRYLGAFALAASGQSADAAANRLLWNNYNRRLRPLRYPFTGGWTYGGAAWQVTAANANAVVRAVLGLAEDAVAVSYVNTATNASAATTGYASVGRNSTAAPLPIGAAVWVQYGLPQVGLYMAFTATAVDNGYPAGLNYWCGMEATQGNTAVTMIGGGGAAAMGLIGGVLA